MQRSKKRLQTFQILSKQTKEKKEKANREVHVTKLLWVNGKSLSPKESSIELKVVAIS